MIWGHCRTCLSLHVRGRLVSYQWLGNFTPVHQFVEPRLQMSTVIPLRHNRSTVYHFVSCMEGSKTFNKPKHIHKISQCIFICNRHIGNALPHQGLKNKQPEKGVGITRDDQQKIAQLKAIQPENPRVLKVSIIGPPNAGKSSLANKLIGWRIATVSAKVHTTRSNAIGVLSEDDTQVIFLDTPGLLSPDKIKKHNLEKSLLTDPYSSLFDADLIIAVIDVSKAWNRSKLDKDILTALTLHGDKKSILVLNKVDQLKCKSDLLTTSRLLTEGIVGGKPSLHYSVSKTDTEIDVLDRIMLKERKQMEEDNEDMHNVHEEKEGTYFSNKSELSPDSEQWWPEYFKKLKQAKLQTKDKRGWEKFDCIFMTCALDGDGVEDIKQYLLDVAEPGPWLYHASMVTDQDPVDMAKLCVREKLLDHLPKEIPYRIEIDVTLWEYDENNYLTANIDLICERRRDFVHVIGHNGDIINKIHDEVKQNLMNTFKQELSLKLNVRKKKNY